MLEDQTQGNGVLQFGEQSSCYLVGDSLLYATLPSPSFHSNNLIIHSAQIHPQRSPRIEMVRNSDRTTRPLGVPDRDVLLKCCRTDDGRLVDARVLPDRVARSVAGDAAFHRAAGGEAEVVFYDVVLDKGVGAPAVDGEQANAATDTKVAAEVDGAITSTISVWQWTE